MRIASLIAAAGLLLAGCTQQAWYGGMQAHSRNECSRLPTSEMRACLERANADFERYRAEREALRAGTR